LKETKQEGRGGVRPPETDGLFEPGARPKGVEAGPLELAPGETLKLRVFVDKSVVEVFANGRQAVMRRFYPSRDDSVNVAVFSDDRPASLATIAAWDMMPSNPY